MKRLGLILILFSCASMSADQCLNANWGIFGEEDGALAKNQLAKYAKACSKYGFDAKKQKEYKDGYIKGLASYCSFDRGKELGINNQPLPTVCPDQYMAKFREGYLIGKDIYYANACSYQSGMQLGLKGAQMPMDCPEKYLSNFKLGYSAGSKEFELNTQVSRLSADLKNQQSLCEEQKEGMKQELASYQKRIQSMGLELSRLQSQIDTQRNLTGHLDE